MVRVSANTATREELIEVSGLRPEIADMILDFRHRHGRITSVDTLQELPGIGPATLEHLRKALDLGEQNGHGSDRAGDAAGAASEVPHETFREPAESIAAFGQLSADLLNEQLQHNLRVALALGQTIDWGEVARAQSDFLCASFERLNRLGSRYIEIVEAMTSATASDGSDQGKKAA